MTTAVTAGILPLLFAITSQQLTSDEEVFPLECVDGWHRGLANGDELLPVEPDIRSLRVLGLQRCLSSTYCYKFRPYDYASTPVTFFGCSDEKFKSDRCGGGRGWSSSCSAYTDFTRQMQGEICCCNDQNFCNDATPTLPSQLFSFLALQIVVLFLLL